MQPHEKKVIRILTKHFRLVKVLRPSNIDFVKTPDVEINGVLWEIKSPTGNSRKTTVYTQLKRAKQQSENIIIDCKRTKLMDEFVIKETKKLVRMKTFKRVKRVMVVKKNGEVVDINE